MIKRSKYPLVFALLLAAGMAGCIKEREVVPAGGKTRPVVFSPQVSRGGESRALAGQSADNVTGQPDETRTLTGTRAMPGHPVENVAGQTDAALIPDGKSFGVFAWVKETAAATVTNFGGLQNMEITRSGSEYTYTPTADWPRDPDATLSFFAYYPYWDSADADESIAVSHGTGADQWMRVAYTVSGDAGQHIDLMYAKTDMTEGYDPVNLNFGHALAWLKFEGRTEGYPVGATLKITGIKIKGATLEGELVVLDPTTQPGKPFWELSDAPADKGDMTVPAAHINSTIELTQTLQSVISTGGDMLVLPQSLDGLTVEVSASLNDTAFPQPFIFALDGTPNWTMNEITTYEITLTPDGMRVAARVADWTTDPVNVIQDGQWWLSVTEDTFEFDPDGGTATLTATTNYDRADLGYPAGLQVNAAEIAYTPAVTSGNEWLSLTPTTVNGTPSTDLSMIIPINAGLLNRSAKIHIKAGNMSKVINVVQEGNSIARRFAKSNIVWVEDSNYPAGGYLTFAETSADNANIPSNVQGLFFAWGSLVAISPAALSGTTATYTAGRFPSGHIVFAPTNNYAYAPSSLPYANETTGVFANHDKTGDDFATYNGGQGWNASTGRGDICRYISSQNWTRGKWRMPTAAEYEQLIAEQTTVPNGSFTSITVAPSGINSYGYGFYQPLSGRWFGAGVTVGGSDTKPNAGIYLPTAGSRTSGNASNAGSGGQYWIGSSGGSSTGFYLSFSSGNPIVSGGVADRLLNLFSIRCIRIVE